MAAQRCTGTARSYIDRTALCTQQCHIAQSVGHSYVAGAGHTLAPFTIVGSNAAPQTSTLSHRGKEASHPGRQRSERQSQKRPVVASGGAASVPFATWRTLRPILPTQSLRTTPTYPEACYLPALLRLLHTAI
jgi:hypothetical protein